MAFTTKGSCSTGFNILDLLDRQVHCDLRLCLTSQHVALPAAAVIPIVPSPFLSAAVPSALLAADNDCCFKHRV